MQRPTKGLNCALKGEREREKWKKYRKKETFVAKGPGDGGASRYAKRKEYLD